MARVIDLSLPIKPHWRWPVEVERTSDFAKGDLFLTSCITLSLHTGTHVDAPLHFVPGQAAIADTELEAWMGEAAVIDCSHRGAEEGVTRSDLDAGGQHVRAEDIVLLRTDWPKKCSYETKEFWAKAPYTTRKACEWLAERGVKALGTDYPPDEVLRLRVTDPHNPRVSDRAEYTTHDVLLSRGILLIEYLTNLHLISRPRVRLLALPLRIEGVDGSPVRAIAIEE